MPYPVIGRIALYAFLFTAYAPSVSAHDWYPAICCSEEDCREVSDTAVRITPDGYLITMTGETIPFASPKRRSSPDGKNHWCECKGCSSQTRCLFTPDQGS